VSTAAATLEPNVFIRDGIHDIPCTELVVRLAINSENMFHYDFDKLLNILRTAAALLDS